MIHECKVFFRLCGFFSLIRCVGDDADKNPVSACSHGQVSQVFYLIVCIYGMDLARTHSAYLLDWQFPKENTFSGRQNFLGKIQL